MAATYEHRADAELYLNRAKGSYKLASESDPGWQRDTHMVTASFFVAMAQVHATLATVK